MAINSPRLVVEPTTQRYRSKETCVHLTSTIPPEDRIVNENSRRTVVSQAPRFEGELLVYRDGTLVQLYVVVDISGVLTWKIAKLLTQVKDGLTGDTFRSL